MSLHRLIYSILSRLVADFLHLLRSLYPFQRPILVGSLTRWYWYGDERYCKCCLYELVFESLEHPTLTKLKYAAESGCRRCRIIFSGIEQYSTANQIPLRDDMTVQVWDTPGAGVEFLVSSTDPKKPIAFEFYFHEGMCSSACLSLANRQADMRSTPGCSQGRGLSTDQTRPNLFSSLRRGSKSA